MIEKIKKSWTQIKQLIITRGLHLKYEENSDEYYIWLSDGIKEYFTIIYKGSGNEDYEEFINSYKPLADIPIHPTTEDGRQIVKTDFRPLGYKLYITGIADSETEIAKGKELMWDFSNDDDLIDMPSGSGEKRKRLILKFTEDYYIKGGLLFYFNVKKNTYIDIYMICPQGQYYVDNDGNPQLATEPTLISRFLTNARIQGTCEEGIYINPGTNSEKIPKEYKVYIDITVPDDDNESNGNGLLEIYRKTTVDL